MNRPEPQRIPTDIWPKMIQYGITPSMNIVLKNGNDEFLFVHRANEPVKGQLWVPGSRLQNGERTEDAVLRIALEELGIRSDLFEVLHVSDRFNQEIYPVADMSDVDDARKRYGPDVETVHYWGGVSYARLHPGAETQISLDSQSKHSEWLDRMPPNAHPYLRWYFDVVREAGFPVPNGEE